MKHRFIPAVLLTVLIAGTFTRPTIAEESARDPAARGPVFLPFDFYARHREDLELNEEQLRKMQGLAESMRDAGQKLEAERRERTQALQDVMAQTPIDPQKAMDCFQAVLKTENEMKALQFRSGLEMRNALSPAQSAKLQPLAMKDGASRGGANPSEIHEMLQRVREEIRKRAGSGEPPREIVEKIEQIEQAAKEGRMSEAKDQLEAMLRHLRNEAASHPPAESKP